MCCCSNLAALSTVPQEKKVNFPSYIDNHDQTVTITCYTYTFAHCHQSSIISMLTHKLTCSVNGLCWKVLSGHFQQMGFPYLYSQSILSPALDDSLRFLLCNSFLGYISLHSILPLWQVIKIKKNSASFWICKCNKCRSIIYFKDIRYKQK